MRARNQPGGGADSIVAWRWQSLKRRNCYGTSTLHLRAMTFGWGDRHAREDVGRDCGYPVPRVHGMSSSPGVTLNSGRQIDDRGHAVTTEHLRSSHRRTSNTGRLR